MRIADCGLRNLGGNDSRCTCWMRIALTRLRRFAPWCILLVVAVRLLFLVTYPPNTGGDAIGYWKMLIHGKSNLVHPPGYPFLVGLPFRGLLAATGRMWMVSKHPVAVQYAVIAFQHAVSVAILRLAYHCLLRLYGRPTAGIAVLLYGLSPCVMGVTSCFYPEWLQADLLVLSLCLGYLGLRARTWAGQWAWYLTMFLAFSWCYLVKYNALLLLPLLPAAVLLAPVSLRRRTALLLGGILVAASSVGMLTECHHRPYTGTRALSRDHAWVLLTALGGWSPGKTLNPETGVWTKRLIYLNSVLPWQPELVGPSWQTDETRQGRARRQPWRDKYLYVLSADETALDELLATVPQPAAPYDFFTAFSPTFNNIGMAEGDRLGTRVFVEHVLRYPGRFAAHAARTAWQSLLLWPRAPFFDTRIDAPEYVPTGRCGFYRRVQDKRPAVGWIWYSHPVVWRPGARLFGVLRFFYRPPASLLFLIVLGNAVVRARAYLLGDRSVATVGVLALALLCAWFFACSCALFFRWKEALPLQPIVAALLAVAAVDGCDRITRMIHGRPQPVAKGDIVT